MLQTLFIAVISRILKIVSLLLQKRTRYCSVWDVVQNWVNIMKDVSKTFPQKNQSYYLPPVTKHSRFPHYCFNSCFCTSAMGAGGRKAWHFQPKFYETNRILVIRYLWNEKCRFSQQNQDPFCQWRRFTRIHFSPRNEFGLSSLQNRRLHSGIIYSILTTAITTSLDSITLVGAEHWKDLLYLGTLKMALATLIFVVETSLRYHSTWNKFYTFWPKMCRLHEKLVGHLLGYRVLF